MEENKIQFDIENSNEQNVQEIPKAEEININTEETKKENYDYDVMEIYNFLKDNGIAPEIKDANFSNVNDIANLIQNNIKEQLDTLLEQRISNYDKSYTDLVNYINNGGDIENFKTNYGIKYDKLEYKDIRNNKEEQYKVVLDYYKKTTNWDENMIKKHLSKFEEEEIQDFSKNALEQLKLIENYNNQILLEEQKKENEKIKQYYEYLTNEYKKNLNELNTIGNNIKLTQYDKKDIETNLFENKTFDKLYNNFDKYRLNLAILDKFGILDDINNVVKLLDANQKENNKNYNFKKNSQNNYNENANIEMNIIQNNSTKQNDNKTLPFIF